MSRQFGTFRWGNLLDCLGVDHVVGLIGSTFAVTMFLIVLFVELAVGQLGLMASL